MKNSVKKICLILLAAMMAIAVSACESNTGKTVENNNPDRATVSFGRYAQDVVTDSAVLAKLAAAQFDEADRTVIGATEYQRVVAAPYRSGAKFTDGVTEIVHGETYYFTVQPIEWYVLESETLSGGSKTTVISKDIIDTGVFSFNTEMTDNGKYANDWTLSELKNNLNGSFISTAFGALDSSSIYATKVDSNYPQSYFKSRATTIEYSWDKVYALSYKEATSAAWGFTEDGTVYDCLRMAEVSDYARAVGAWFYVPTVSESSENYEREMLFAGKGDYWLRTVGFGDAEAAVVRYNGSVGKHEKYVANSCGIRPVMSVAISVER